jgi:peptide chain release factor 1
MAELEELKEQMQKLEKDLTSPEILQFPSKIADISKEYNQIREKINRLEKLAVLNEKIEEAEAILNNEKDPELLEMAQSEIEKLKHQKEKIEKGSTSNANGPSKNVILEIRAGTGGEEAALFAADLYRMYTRFAERRGWSTELLSTNRTGIGGFKEAIFKISGQGAYESLIFESGVHRVQRIPETEKTGRIHTSTASVAVLPEATEVDIKIKPEDLEIETYRSSGKGGQNVQKVETAVRILHRPTGIIVACQEERSQGRNKEKAIKVLMAKLLAMEEEKKIVKLSEQRRSQIGQAKRVEKIRTYNFPQNRVTDHRLNKSWFNILEIMDGRLDEIVKDLSSAQ